LAGLNCFRLIFREIDFIDGADRFIIAQRFVKFASL